MNTALKDELIKDFENKVNNKINTLYDVFYVQPYRGGFAVNSEKYGCMLNGMQIALCENLHELEQVINTIIFFLDGGITKK